MTSKTDIGKAAENAFHKAMTSNGWLKVFPLHDARGTAKRTTKGYVSDAEAAPADFLVIDRRPVLRSLTLYEIKATENKTGIPLSNFDKGQLQTAALFTDNMNNKGNRFYFVIHNVTDDVWYLVPGGTVAHAYEKQGRSGKLSWSYLKVFTDTLSSIAA